jgi:hypothetical protein
MRYLLFFLCWMIDVSGHAFSIRAGAPARYEVREGDTLWSIAEHYLTNPWEWKSLWHANPQITHPSRLYPGAVIELRYDKQRPYLKVLSNGTIKLSPYVRPLSSEEAIPPIPLSDLRPFLNGSLVIDKNRLAHAPFVIAFGKERMLGAEGEQAYVKDLCPHNELLPSGVSLSYAIYRPCGVYREPGTKRFLGYKTTLIAYAELVRGGDPATIEITDIIQPVKLQDRVMPNDHPDFNLFFEPKTPNVLVNGLIIDLLGDYTQGAVGLVALIDRGKDSGLQPGDVLAVYGKPGLAKNSAYRFDKKPPCEAECVTIPPERIADIMIFRTFTHTSAALVVRSTRAITRLDTVQNP